MNDSSHVAIYWDFENLHASLVDQHFGEGTYRSTQYQAQEPLVNIDAIVAFAAGLGPVAVNRAYCNWQSFMRYRHALLSHAVELVQLFHLGPNAKNGADIRLALDALEDLERFPCIGHVIVVGGDSDFIPLAQKIRQRGRRITGIGAQRSASAFWVTACSGFRYYRTLLDGDAVPEAAQIEDAVPSDPRSDPGGPIDYEATMNAAGIRFVAPERRRDALRRLLVVFQTAPGGLIYDFSDIDERATEGLDEAEAEQVAADLRTLRRSLYALYMFEMHGRGNGIGLKFSDSLDGLLGAYADRLIQRLVRNTRGPLDAEEIAELIDGPEGRADPEVVALVEAALEPRP